MVPISYFGGVICVTCAPLLYNRLSSAVRKTAAFALALLGLFDSLYLWWVYASPSHPLVCLGTGCDVVRASRYSHLWGVPVPVFGVALYVTLVLLIFFEPMVPAVEGIVVRRASAVLAGAGFAVAAALTALEVFVIHAWCAWCVVQAIAITLIFVLSLICLRAPAYPDQRHARRQTRWYAMVLVLAIVAGIAGFLRLARAGETQAQSAPALLPEKFPAQLVRPDSHVTGNPDSPVTFVEFGDLQCPACGAANPAVVELRRRFGSRVRLVFRQFPLERIHAYALHAALASECAGQQGKFWEAVDRFYGAQGDLQDDSLMRYAGELGLDTAKLRACMADPATAARVERDVADGRALGVRATPTFFLARRHIEGPLPLAQFEQMLREEIAAAMPANAEKSVTAATTGKKPPSSKAPPAAAAGLTFGGSSSGGFLTVQGASTDCDENAPSGPDVPMIRTADAEKLFHSGAAFVDVRAADDYAKAHIASAKNVPFTEAGSRAGELPRDRTIVLYEANRGSAGEVCAASRAAARALLARGFKDVRVYEDGLAGWRKENLPVEQ